MSLVNEALKRARAQSALQEAGQGPLAHVVTPAHYSEPKRRVWPIVAASSLAAFVVAILCVTLMHRAKQPAPNPVSEGTSPTETPVAAATPVVRPRVSLSLPPSTPTQSVAAASPAPSAPAPALPAAQTRPAMSVEAEAANSRPDAAVAAPAPADVAPTGLVEGKVYLQTIDLPDAPKVKLDGILWSEKQPVALINGINLAPGDDLDGVTVVAIEPKRVKLLAQNKHFFIRLP